MDQTDEGRRREILGDLRFISACALLAALLGLAHNLVDCRISPEFYRIVKGVTDPTSITMAAAWIGLSRGAPMGILGGVVITMASEGGPPPTLRTATVPIAFALLGSLVVGTAATLWRLPALSPSSQRYPAMAQLTAPEQRSLNVVSGMHSGLYAGAAIGMLEACRRARRRRVR